MMSHRPSRPSLILPALAAFVLSSCATADASYPSLAVRDFERAEGQFETPPTKPLDVPRVPVSVEGDLDSHLAALLAEAQSAHASFEASTAAAMASVRSAANAPVESNAWAAAQVALADLDSSRSRTAIILADLDMLYAAVAIQYEERGAIANTRSQVAALILQEDVVLNELRKGLR